MRGHSDEGYFDIASWIDSQGAAGNPDRQPIVGATYIERNIEFFGRMLEAKGLSHQERDKRRNLELVWWRPAGTSWGASHDLDVSISSIKGSVRRASRSWRVRSTLVVPQVSRHENNKRFERIFDQACIAPAGHLSPAVEVVLLKGAGAIVTVCVRLSAVTFVPVGFVIVDIPTINALEKALRLNDIHEFHQLWRHVIREDDEVAVAEEAAV